MARSPAFQWYARDFLCDEDVVCMSNEQVGAYTRLLCHCWLEEGLPKDDKKLAKLSLAGRRWNRIREPVMACFYLDSDDRYQHKRLNEEREKQREWSEKSRKGGKKSAEKRAQERAREVEPPLVPTEQPKGNTASSSSSSSPETTTEDAVVLGKVESNGNTEARQYLIQSGITDLINDPGTLDKILATYPLDEIKRYGEHMLKQNEAGKVENPAAYLQWALKKKIDMSASNPDGASGTKIRRPCPACNHKATSEARECSVCNGTGALFLTDEDYRVLTSKQAQIEDGEDPTPSTPKKPVPEPVL